MSKNTFPLIARKGVGLSFQALTKHQNGVFCFHIATVLLSGSGASWSDPAPVSRTGAGSGPDWARTSDPALIKRML
jgi:hypothetical protein